MPRAGSGKVKHNRTKKILKQAKGYHAESLGINMHTVRSAYLKLRDQGIINLRLGRKARVAPLHPLSASPASTGDIADRLKEVIIDALLVGQTPDHLRQLFDRQLEQIDREWSK